MNAQVNLATMEELARIHHKDIDVSAHQVLLDFSAMRKIVTVINRPVQSAQCAEMSQESAISAVSVEPDIKVSFYILPKTHHIDSSKLNRTVIPI